MVFTDKTPLNIELLYLHRGTVMAAISVKRAISYKITDWVIWFSSTYLKQC